MQVMVYIKIIIVKKISFYSFNSDPTLDTWMSDIKDSYASIVH